MKMLLNLANIILIGLIVFMFSNTSLAQITFTNVQQDVGEDFGPITYPNMPAWGDVDNDGDLDVYVSQGDTNGLYLNDLSVSGKFMLADTTIMPIVRGGAPRSVIMGDLENDGDLDIIVVKQAVRVWVLQNKLADTGSLSFVDIAAQNDMVHEGEKIYSATMVDYNNDSLLDILITGLANESYIPTVLYKNLGVVDGQLKFVESADEAGILSTFGLQQMCPSWGDYDDDGDQDLIIPTCCTFPVFVYNNNGDGTFTEVSVETGLIASVGNARGSDWIDYDNDGDLDVYISRVTYYNAPEMDHCELWRNDGGVFHEVESIRVTHRTMRGMAWGDYDNDGDLDLHLLEEGGKDMLFRNDGNDVFVELAGEVGLLKTKNAFGFMADISDRGGQTWADWDADGDLDIFLAGTTVPYLMRNDGGNANNWLELKLIGVQSNRSAVGARVIAVAQDLRQMREVKSGSGYLTGPPLDLHFGLEQRTVVDSLIIRWPSGVVDVFTNIAANQILSIEEGSGSTGVESKNNGAPKDFVLYQNYPNPFNPTTQISYELLKSGHVRLDVYSTLGQRVATIVDEHQPAGKHRVQFNSENLAAALYVYRLSVGDFVQQKKMILIE